nr:PREDICTED: uncharacterized protein LOC100881823 isoform X2 [Megachile rotundata]
MDKELSNNKNLCDKSDATENDSILDFKSPKLQNQKAKLNELFNYNIKRKNAVIKSKGSVKNHKETKFKHNSEKERKVYLKSQPSIESSFFKSEGSSNDNKNDDNIIKEALVCPLCFKTFKELNSQAIHMKICAYKNNISTKKLLDAIELQKRQESERKSLGLLAAPIVQERKKIASRKVGLHEESDLQLALALSKSLQEVEELDEINELEGLPKTLTRSVSEIVEPISEKQLERFGFASSKPPSLIKNKRKRDNQVTLLQTRSQDERNRILTERISEILMEDEPITQSKNDTIYDEKIKQEIAPRSHLLKQFLYKENETTLKFTNTCNLKETNLSQYKTNISNNKEVLYDSSDRELNFINEKCENCRDKQFINALVTNWRSALNNSSASDVIIFVNDNKHIWAHKLIFYVQCPNILLDITPNDSSVYPQIKEKISWTDISYNVALQFLEFIYCGIIEKYFCIFEELKNLSSLRSLARKYKVERLFDYLERKEIENKKAHTYNVKNSEFENELAYSERSNLQLSNNCLDDLICEESSEENICLSNVNTSRYCSMSPDMFDDINDTVSKNKIAVALDKSKNNESLNILNSIDEVRLNNTDVNTSSSKKVKKYLNSISNGSHLSEQERKNYLVPLKSNLSLFIERFQKENAKSDFDSDPENSVLSIFSKPNRNPFNVRNDDSPDQRSTSHENTVIKETLDKERRNVLSIFDNYTSPELNTKMLHEKNNDSICQNFGTIESVECNIENCTENQLKNNLVNKSIINVETENQSKIIERNVDLQVLHNKSANTSSISKYNEDSIQSEIVADEDEISMYSKYRQEHEHNSILKYRDYIKRNALQNDTMVNLEYENMDNDITLPSDINKDSEIKGNSVEQYETQTKRSSKTYKQISVQNSCDLSNEFFDKDKNDFSINAVSPISSRKNVHEVQGINNVTTLRYSKSENDIAIEVIRKSLSTQSDMYECNSLKSPISISSSTESDFDVSNLYKSQEDKNDRDSNFEKSLNNYSIERDNYLANVHINDEDDNNSISISLSSIEDIDQLNKCNSVQTCNINKEEIPSIINNDNIDLKKRSSIQKQNDRKFKKKSISETNLNIHTKSATNINSLKKSECKCHKKISRVAKSPVIIRNSNTPPPNYNEMKTPELHEKLNRYGLKIQKRKKAVKLLTYIYNELHPTISTSGIESEFTNISSEDEEPPMKKINYDKSDTNSIDDNDCELLLSPDSVTSNHSQITITNEEKQFNESQSINVADNTQNMKDILLKFITTNKVLHNKILAYEPLCIDSLHSSLKAEGFKCKMNTLMDFLDEQCITFYFNEAKHRKDKKN